MRHPLILIAGLLAVGAVVTFLALGTSDVSTDPASLNSARADAPEMVDPGPLVDAVLSFDEDGVTKTFKFARQDRNTFSPDGFTVTASGVDNSFPYISINVADVDLTKAEFPLTIQPAADVKSPIIRYTISDQQVAGVSPVIIESFSNGRVAGRIAEARFINRAAQASRIDDLRFDVQLTPKKVTQ